jgi:hypothetical protein
MNQKNYTIAAPKKEHKDLSFSVKSVDEKGIFTGYASLFGEEDFGGDIVQKGAFTRTLKEQEGLKRKFPVLWQHKWDEPIGVYDEIYEDEKGLFVKGRLLIDEVQKSKEAYALMREGAVTGLSIGYGVKEYSIEIDDDDDWNYTRTLIDIDLYEVSQVTFPMLDSARIDAVKNKISAGKLPSLKEFEDFLRESGFSKTQSVAIANNGLKYLLRSESAAEDAKNRIIQSLDDFKLPTF